MHKLTPDEKLIHTIINSGRKNMNEWFERIIRDYIEEQAIEDRESVETIKNKSIQNCMIVSFVLFCPCFISSS